MIPHQLIDQQVAITCQDTSNFQSKGIEEEEEEEEGEEDYNIVNGEVKECIFFWKLPFASCLGKVLNTSGWHQEYRQAMQCG